MRLVKRLTAWFQRGVDRSPQEVAEILETFLVGEPSGFLADNFMTTPIANPMLEGIRNAFETLVDSEPTWEPQQPFPENARGGLQCLVERARAAT